MKTIIILIFGLMFGSFINALVWRVHEQTKNKQRKNLSILKGRSQCVHCGHVLAAKDLIPVASWVGLRGKCRYCRKQISAQYPVVEILTGALFALSFVAWPYGLNGGGIFLFGVWLVILVHLIALTVYDIKWMLLPNRLVLPLTGVSGLFILAAALYEKNALVLIGGILAAGLLFGLFYLLYAVSGGKWIGGGDVKLAVALGLISLSPIKAILLLFIASLLGTLISLPLIITNKLKRSSQIPFGPLLIAAAIIVVLFGQKMIDWYTGTFLYI